MSQLEQPNKNNNPYASPEDMAQKLGLAIEEATNVWNMWNYKKPTDPNEALEYANKAHRYEDGMKGLNADLRMGAITQAEYQTEERKLHEEIYGK